MTRRTVAIGGLMAALLAPAVPAANAQELSGLGATHVYGPGAHDLARLPSDAEVMAAWPPAAKAKGHGGSAVMRCKADGAGTLSDCQVMLERSGRESFGPALLSLAPAYRLKHAAAGGRPEQTDVVISATWPAPETPVTWQVEPKPGDFSTTATPGVWRLGGKGEVVMNCLNARMGALHDCMVVYQDPPGVGFGAMALRFQGFLKLNPATVGGRPIESGLDIAIKFRAQRPGETP
jgi:TonB family protein